MPKAIDFRLKGISFEDAVKRLANTPPIAKQPAPKKARKSPRRKR